MLQLGHRDTEIKKVMCSKKKIKAINSYKFKKSILTFLDIRNWLKRNFKRIKTQMHKPGNLKKAKRENTGVSITAAALGSTVGHISVADNHTVTRAQFYVYHRLY